MLPRALLPVLAAGLVFALAQGLSYPLLSILQEKQGLSATFIGVSAAMTPLGILLTSPLTPRLVARFDARGVVMACCGAVALLYLAIWAVDDPWAWLPLRFGLGCALNPIFLMSEVWAISVAPAGQKGRTVAALAMTFQIGFASGPAVLGLLGEEGFAPFGVAIVAYMGCLAILALAKGLPEPGRGHAPESPFRMVRLAPVLLGAVAVVAGFEAAALSLLPLYAGAHGHAETAGAWLLAAMIGGSIAFTPLAGWAAERFGARRAMVWAAMAGAAGAPLLPLTIETPLAYVYLALWGGIYFAIYALALVEAGERFAGPQLVALNAAIGVMWGFGGLSGAPLAGAAMDLAGPEALPATFTLLLGGLAVAAWLRNRPRPA